MPGRRWTAEEEMIVIRDIDRARPETLARRVGRTPKAVARWCERQGVSPTTSGLLTSGDAAAISGHTPQALTAMARRRQIRARRVPGGRWWLFYPEALPARDRS